MVVVLLIWLVLHVQTKSVVHAKNIIKILLNFKYVRKAKKRKGMRKPHWMLSPGRRQASKKIRPARRRKRKKRHQKNNVNSKENGNNQP